VQFPVLAYMSGGGCTGQGVRDEGSPCGGGNGGSKDNSGKRHFNAAQMSRWAEVSPVSSFKSKSITRR
jgi:hypothetical protein